MAAFADLNVTCLNNPRETEKLVSKAVKLGFETIALCQTFRLETVKKERKGAAKLTPVNLGNYPAIQDMKKINPRLKVYTRLTVQLDDQSQVHQLSSDPVQSHDILAVQPATEKLFQQACKTLDVDIISLDMTERLPFYLKFPTVNAANERGIHFEIVYSSAIRDSSQRKNLISTALDLVVFAKGKNIIISSGAVNELDFRGPYDIINLGLLFNLKEEQSKAAITKNCRDVLFHADARKGTERSVISGKLLKEPAELLSDKEEGDISEDCTGHSKEQNVDDNDEGDNYEPKEKKSKVE